jgi:rare lipoprotein A
LQYDRAMRGAWLLVVCLLVLTGCTTGRAVRTEPPGRVEPSALRGQASWYGHPHHGRRTTSGEVYDMNKLTAAHRTLPLGTRVLVTNLDNGRTVEVRINDRGPVRRDRVLDLSYAAARRLGALGEGVIPVSLRILGD